MIPSVFASSLPIANEQGGQSQGSSQPSTSASAASSSSAGTSRPSAVQYSSSSYTGPSLTVPVTSNPPLDPWATTSAPYANTAANNASTATSHFNSSVASTGTWDQMQEASMQQWQFMQSSQAPPQLVHSNSDPTAHVSAQGMEWVGQHRQYQADRAASQPLSTNQTQQQPSTQNGEARLQDHPQPRENGE